MHVFKLNENKRFFSVGLYIGSWSPYLPSILSQAAYETTPWQADEISPWRFQNIMKS